MSSEKDNETEIHCQVDCNEVYQYEDIKILDNYIPHPDSIISDKLAELASQVNTKLQHLKLPVRGPYLSKSFGDIRKEAFAKFELVMNEYPEPKRSDYLRQFYNVIDVQSQKSFETAINLKEIYRQIIQEKDFSSNSPTMEDNPSETNYKEMTHEQAVKLLNKSILWLTVDWYIVLERIVDVLVKSQVYHIKKCSIYKDLYTKINNRIKRDERQTWREKIVSNLHFSFQKKGAKHDETEEKMPYADAMDCHDIFVLVARIACGEIVSKMFKDLRHDPTNKELLTKIKGFFLFINQSLQTLLDELNKKFEACLEAQGGNELLEKQQLKDFDLLINELVIFQESVSIFDNKFAKTHLSYDDHNWMEVVKLERSLSDMQSSQEKRKTSFQNFRAASSCNLK